VLIAEELVLLALQPDGKLARGASNQSSVAVGVTGALVAELAIDGHLEVVDGRIRLTGTRPTHPLLAQVLDNVEPHEGKQLKSRLGAIKHSGWSEVVDAMIDAGTLGRDSAPLRPTRHPVNDLVAHAQLLADVRAAAAGAPLDARLATLLALSGPCQLLEVVVPDRADRKAAKARIDAAAEQVPVAGAVKAVIAEVQAAVIVAIAASSVASSSS